MKKAFVLLSGGLDSTTLLYHALCDCRVAEAVSINYGQRHKKELEYAAQTCERLDISHKVIQLNGLLGGHMLTDGSIPIPDKRYDELDGVSPTYVPFRNGTMLAILAAHAQSWVKHMDDAGNPDASHAVLYFGAHADDAHNWAYPDCTPEFIGAMANAIFIGTYYKVRLLAPFMSATKEEIVRRGAELGVPFEATWSCYKGEANHCGQCPTCYSRKEAFEKAGVPDPTIYAPQHRSSDTVNLKAALDDK